MAYQKIRRTIPKKRFVFTIYNGKSVRRIRVRAYSIAQGRASLKKKYPNWRVINHRGS